MTTLKNQLCTIMLLFGITFFTNVYAQKPAIETGMFIRVYNLKGQKIGKGKLFTASDTLLTLKKNSKFINIEPLDIGIIKTKRSVGHNFLMGSIIGGTSMAVLGAASADPDAWIFGYTAAEGATGGVVVGGISGAAIGGITILFKNSKKFIINGDKSNWKAFEKLINN